MGRTVILQALWFQAIWFSAIFGQNEFALLLVCIFACHLLISKAWRSDLKIWPIAVVGFCGDLLLTWLGVFEFAAFPLWLAIIWLSFALTLLYSMAWLERFNIFGQAVIGGCTGCLSYLAGARLDAVELPFGIMTTAIILAVYWSILLPSMINAKQKLMAKA